VAGFEFGRARISNHCVLISLYPRRQGGGGNKLALAAAAHSPIERAALQTADIVNGSASIREIAGRSRRFCNAAWVSPTQVEALAGSTA
jgi:hypothetical protein